MDPSSDNKASAESSGGWLSLFAWVVVCLFFGWAAAMVCTTIGMFLSMYLSGHYYLWSFFVGLLMTPLLAIAFGFGWLALISVSWTLTSRIVLFLISAGCASYVAYLLTFEWPMYCVNALNRC